MKKRNFFQLLVVASLALPVVFSSCKKDEEDPTNDVVQEVAVNGVSLNEHELNIYANDEVTLKATVNPSDATKKDVYWTSDDKNVAKVSDKGVVTGVGAGCTYIFVTTVDGNKKDSCKVNVSKGIKISDENFLAALIANSDINKDGDDFITRVEAEAAEILNVNAKDIASLDGIQFFVNLKELRCAENKLTSLDIKNLTKLNTLKCDENKLTSLVVKNSPDLVYLNCAKNQLDSLVIRDNAKIETILCGNQANNLKLVMSVDQYNNLWKEKGSSSSNAKVDIVMNVFEGVVFQSSKFDENLKSGSSFSISKDEDSFTFRIYNGKTNENVSFYEKTVYDQLTWASSDESVATISPSVSGSAEAYSVSVEVTLKSVGETVISSVDGEGNKISFTLNVTK